MFFDNDIFYSGNSFLPATGFTSGRDPLDWNNIINQGFGIGSQAIAAWGRNPTQQIGNSSVIGIGQGYSPAALLSALNQQRMMTGGGGSVPGSPNTGGVGSTVGSGLDGIVEWATKNPLPVFLGIAGVFLLFRQPPGRR